MGEGEAGGEDEVVGFPNGQNLCALHQHYHSPVTNLKDLTASQLRRIIAVKEQIAALQSRLQSIVGGNGEIPIPSPVAAPVPVKRKLSAAHRRKLIKALAKARKIRWAKLQGTSATDSKPAKKNGRRTSLSGNSGRDEEVRETGRGLVEHLDEIGRQQGHAQLIEYLTNLRIHYTEDNVGPGAGHGFRVKIRDPFHPDTMPDWLKLHPEQFPALGEVIYSFADRHRDRVLRRHERSANINGLSNFIDVMVATSRVLYVYLRRGVLTQPQVTSRLRKYLNIFTGRIPLYRDEEPTGYLARLYSNGNGNLGQFKKSLEERNVAGHLRALLLVAQVVRGSQDGSDASPAGTQLPLLVDQIKLFENKIGLVRATASQIGRALEDYEMLTKQELALWTRDLKSSRDQIARSQDPARGESHHTTTESQKQGSSPPSSNQGQTQSSRQSEMGEGQGEGEYKAVTTKEVRLTTSISTVTKGITLDMSDMENS